MRSDAQATQVVLAVKRAIEATFSKGDWRELALVTDSDDVIRGHHRLLRSLEWGDNDYSGNVLRGVTVAQHSKNYVRLLSEVMHDVTANEGAVGTDWDYWVLRPTYAAANIG